MNRVITNLTCWFELFTSRYDVIDNIIILSKRISLIHAFLYFGIKNLMYMLQGVLCIRSS